MEDNFLKIELKDLEFENLLVVGTNSTENNLKNLLKTRIFTKIKKLKSHVVIIP